MLAEFGGAVIHFADGQVDSAGDMPGLPLGFGAHIDQRQVASAIEPFAKFADGDLDDP